MKVILVVLSLLAILHVGGTRGATTGNAQLRDAVNAALAVVFSNGNWVDYSSQYSIGLRTQDCAPSAVFYPYPTNPTGTLQEIITTGTWKLSISFTAPPLSFLQGTTLTGFEVLLWNRVAQLIGQHYGATISIDWVNSDGYPFFSLVTNGLADGFIGANLPGLFNSTTMILTSEAANVACSHYTSSVTVLSGPTFTGTLSLATFNSATIKIGSYLSAETPRAEVHKRAPLAIVNNVAYQANDYPTLYGWLQTGVVDAVIGYGATNEYFRVNTFSSDPAYQTLTFNVSFLRGFVARRDVGQAPNPSRYTSVDGNQQLLQAFQASLANMYFTSTWSQIANKYSIYEEINDCAPKGNDYYPYPAANELLSGNLKNVIKDKKLNICYNNVSPFYSASPSSGYYYDLLNKFASDLKAQYSVSSDIAVNFKFSSTNPVFADVYDNTCHGYIGSITPGSLGLINGVYTTTAQRLYQSCAINNDAIAILSGPSFVGTLSIAALHALPAGTKVGSVLTSNSSRNYVQQYFPNLDFTSIYPSATDAYNAVKNSEISIAIAQLITGTSFINSLSAAQAAQMQIITLYDRQLYSVSFYKPDVPEPNSASVTAFSLVAMALIALLHFF